MTVVKKVTATKERLHYRTTKDNFLLEVFMSQGQSNLRNLFQATSLLGHIDVFKQKRIKLSYSDIMFGTTSIKLILININNVFNHIWM